MAVVPPLPPSHIEEEEGGLTGRMVDGVLVRDCAVQVDEEECFLDDPEGFEALQGRAWELDMDPELIEDLGLVVDNMQSRRFMDTIDEAEVEHDLDTPGRSCRTDSLQGSFVQHAPLPSFQHEEDESELPGHSAPFFPPETEEVPSPSRLRVEVHAPETHLPPGEPPVQDPSASPSQSSWFELSPPPTTTATSSCSDEGRRRPGRVRTPSPTARLPKHPAARRVSPAIPASAALISSAIRRQNSSELLRGGQQRHQSLEPSTRPGTRPRSKSPDRSVEESRPRTGARPAPARTAERKPPARGAPGAPQGELAKQLRNKDEEIARLREQLQQRDKECSRLRQLQTGGGPAPKSRSKVVLATEAGEEVLLHATNGDLGRRPHAPVQDPGQRPHYGNRPPPPAAAPPASSAPVKWGGLASGQSSSSRSCVAPGAPPPPVAQGAPRIPAGAGWRQQADLAVPAAASLPKLWTMNTAYLPPKPGEPFSPFTIPRSVDGDREENPLSRLSSPASSTMRQASSPPRGAETLQMTSPEVRSMTPIIPVQPGLVPVRLGREGSPISSYRVSPPTASTVVHAPWVFRPAESHAGLQTVVHVLQPQPHAIPVHVQGQPRPASLSPPPQQRLSFKEQPPAQPVMMLSWRANLEASPPSALPATSSLTIPSRGSSPSVPRTVSVPLAHHYEQPPAPPWSQAPLARAPTFLQAPLVPSRAQSPVAPLEKGLAMPYPPTGRPQLSNVPVAWVHQPAQAPLLSATAEPKPAPFAAPAASLIPALPRYGMPMPLPTEQQFMTPQVAFRAVAPQSPMQGVNTPVLGASASTPSLPTTPATSHQAPVGPPQTRLPVSRR